METTRDNLSGPERITPEWETLVFICAKCKGARRGPDSREIRKGLKHRIGKTKTLRVLESDCMDVCPDDAVTVCLSKHRSGTVDVVLVRSEAELDALAAQISRA